MKSKQELLLEIQEGLSTGVLTEVDLRQFIMINPVVNVVSQPKVDTKHDRLSAVDVMFYIAGIVLFSTIMSVIVQSWETGNSITHIVLSAVFGMGLWGLAYYLIKNPIQNDIRKGLTNSLLLTGSMLLVVGGYIVTNEAIGGYSEVNYLPAAAALLLLGCIHIAFDDLVKRDLILLMGILLGVASFPALMLGILQDASVSFDVWALIFLVAAGILAFATRVLAKMNPGRLKIHNAFDSLSAQIGLGTIYVASYTQYGILWFGALIAGVFGIFYLSIISQNKQMLGSASVFMVLGVLTVSFKYFSGGGITLSLVIATIGLLGSAAIASGINKKYFKQPISPAKPQQ